MIERKKKKEEIFFDFFVSFKTKFLGLFPLHIICLVDEKMRERTLIIFVFCVFKFEAMEHPLKLTVNWGMFDSCILYMILVFFKNDKLGFYL